MKCKYCGIEKSYTINNKCPICDNENLQNLLRKNQENKYIKEQCNGCLTEIVCNDCPENKLNKKRY